jgi:hypothetical protein
LDHALDFALSNKVEYVVFAADWVKEAHFAGIVSDLLKLKSAGIKVVIVGPAVTFSKPVPKFIARRGAGDDLKSLSMKDFK